MTLEQALDAVPKPDRAAMGAAQARLNSLVKPLGSLGLLEQALVKIAGITGSSELRPDRKATVVFCADNGVIRQGISQTGSHVTAIVAQAMTTGDTCVCAMSRVAGSDVIPVDIGMCADMEIDGLIRGKVARGTADISQQPAMTRAQAVQALETGIDLACRLQAQGYGMIATGEMGIGNTTTAAAMAGVLLDLPPEQVTGRGAGLSDEGFSRKREVIRMAIQSHRPNPNDPIDVLAKVGGFDIAGMAGLCIGGAVCGLPVVLDGMISTVAALTACRLQPDVVHCLLASHLSPEPAGVLLLEALGLSPMIHAEMRVGEGAGAVTVFPLLDMAMAVYRDMATFDQAGMEAYQPLS